MVRTPMRDSLRTSASEATPRISVENTRGTAMSLRKLRNRRPKGAIQAAVNASQPDRPAISP